MINQQTGIIFLRQNTKKNKHDQPKISMVYTSITKRNCFLVFLFSPFRLSCHMSALISTAGRCGLHPMKTRRAKAPEKHRRIRSIHDGNPKIRKRANKFLYRRCWLVIPVILTAKKACRPMWTASTSTEKSDSLVVLKFGKVDVENTRKERKMNGWMKSCLPLQASS